MSEEIEFAELTTTIVAAYVGNNPVARDKLPEIIQSVHSSLGALSAPTVLEPSEPQEPAVSIKKSLNKDRIVCLECGKAFKSIKRHLGTSHELTPVAYREKWNLKSDYPMVAPEYAARRSHMAKGFGLGLKPKSNS